MPKKDKYPSLLRMSTVDPDTVYHRVEDAAVPSGLEQMAAQERKGAAASAGSVGEPLPAYTLGLEGPPAIATGTVLVRFAEGENADTRNDDLRAAGYEIERRLPYAPHAVLVRARTGKVSDALNDLGRLERIPGVVNVEPQMIMERAKR